MMQIKQLNANPTKWSNTLKQFVDSVFDSSSVFDHFDSLYVFDWGCRLKG